MATPLIEVSVPANAAGTPGTRRGEASPAPSSALRLQGVRFKYREGFAVQVPSFSLAPGEQALLTGPSGSGKSTLLHIIAGLVDVQAGKVEVAGVDMAGLRGARRDLHRGAHLGMIFQTFNLLQGFTAAENVMAALMFSRVPRAEHRRRAEDLLMRLGLNAPGAPVERLSIGQQQRVAVARAVACGPALVLADEPTASLDPENAAGAMALIQTACREAGAALLCVSHDPSLAALFTRRERMESIAMTSATAAPSAPTQPRDSSGHAGSAA
ncbi:ABC transporter ATP-binding protein [soil metagenome]